MTIKTIAVGLLTASEAEWLLPAACALADQYRAHLIAIHPVEPLCPYVGFEGGIDTSAGPMFDQWQIEETEAIRKKFDQVTLAQSFVSEWRAQPVMVPGAEEFLVESVRSADLVVLGQLDPENGRRDHLRLQEYTIRESGRPVLVLPHKSAPMPIGTHALIAWSSTREATRAAHDARMLIKAGAQVDIVHIGGGALDSDAQATFRRDMAAAMDRHGFKTRLVTCPPGTGGVDAALLQVAFEQGADLIVSGAFGHSRIYDFVIGAVTRGLMETARIAVLFAK
ncbi:MAG: universal stress protein [Paracoccaceae bacterium]|nr:universal stress protein [Paracoccaceae bacterium]